MSFEDRKYFVIGLNKTGTTTLGQFFIDHNIQLGDQIQGEKLLNEWYKKDFDPIIDFAKSAQAFQDLPFSLPHTYAHLHEYFPRAKFILSVRTNAEVWYDSLISYHSKLWATRIGRAPSNADLKKAVYHWEGFPFEMMSKVFGELDYYYDKKLLVQYYNNHISAVKEYFKPIPESLIMINVNIEKDYFRLCQFLDIHPRMMGFSWLNKTKNL